jgi:hypothetical protein
MTILSGTPKSHNTNPGNMTSSSLKKEPALGDDSYEVQIDTDKTSKKATKVDVTTNAWKTDATKKALKANHQGQARR